MKHLDKILFAIVFCAAAAFAGVAEIKTVVVGTSETTLLDSEGGSTARTSYLILNPASNTNSVFIKYTSATNAVTVANGIELVPGASFSPPITSGASAAKNKVTAIAAVATTVRVQSDNAR